MTKEVDPVFTEIAALKIVMNIFFEIVLNSSPGSRDSNIEGFTQAINLRTTHIVWNEQPLPPEALDEIREAAVGIIAGFRKIGSA